MAYLAQRLAEDSVLRDDVTVKSRRCAVGAVQFRDVRRALHQPRQVARRRNRGNRMDGRACAMPTSRITSL